MAFLPNQGVDPALLQQQAQGMSAANRMKSLQGGPAMAQALRQVETPLDQMQGRGWAATAANPLQALATIVQRQKGQGRLDEMQKESEALRGKAEEGQLAQLQAQQQNVQANRAFQEKQAADARSQQDKWKEMEQRRPRSNAETWINEDTGQTMNMYRDGRGLVNADTGELAETEGFKKLKDAGGGLGARIGDMPVFAQKEIIGARKGVLDLNDINAAAGKLSQGDILKLNNPAMMIAVQVGTPGAFEEFVKQNKMGLSQDALNYLQKVNQFSTKVRHQFFGSALTANEQKLAEAFLPSAGGLTLQGRQERIAGFAQDLQNVFTSHDPQGFRKLAEAVPYRPYTPSDQEAAPGWVGGFGPSQIKVFDKYKRENQGQFHPQDPRSKAQKMQGAVHKGAFPQTMGFGAPDPTMMENFIANQGGL